MNRMLKIKRTQDKYKTHPSGPGIILFNAKAQS